VYAFFVFLTPLPVFLGLVDLVPYAPTIAFLAVAVAAHLRYRYLQILLCPHCGKPPAPYWRRMRGDEVDCCSNCQYWLRDPRRGGVGT
jgi:hypothetical protein